MFELVKSREHMWDVLRHNMIENPTYFNIYNVAANNMASGYVDARINSAKYPMLICPYASIRIVAGRQAVTYHMSYFQCKRKDAKSLLYPRTNKIDTNIWKLCKNMKDYYNLLNKINHRFNPTHLEDASQAIGLLTYVAEMSGPIRRVKIMSLTAREAKSLVYYEKDKGDYGEALIKRVKKKVMRRNNIGGEDDTPL